MQIPIPPRESIPAGKVHVQRFGHGPTWVLIHGFPLNSEMWSNQRELGQQLDLVVPDLRGFGQSSPLVDGWTVADFAIDLRQMLETLEVPSAIICGLSLGGYIALEFWARYPQQTAGLVLCNTRATADDETAARGRKIMAEKVRREGTGSVAETMLPKLLATANLDREFSPPVGRFFEHLNPESIALTQLAMSQRQDFSGKLDQIECPVQVIAGEDDAITPAVEMRRMASEIRSAVFDVIPQAGHLTPLENPAAFNQAVLRQWT